MTAGLDSLYGSHSRRRRTAARGRCVSDEDVDVLEHPSTQELRDLRSERYKSGTARDAVSQNSHRQPINTSSIPRTSRHGHDDRHKSKHESDTRVTHSYRDAQDEVCVYGHPISVQNKGRSSSTLSKQPDLRVVYIKSERDSGSQHTRRTSIMQELSLGRSSTTASRRQHQETSALREHRRSSSRRSLAIDPRQTERSGFMGLFPTFAPASKRPSPPPRLVECMTCLSDDIPHNKSAKLKCGHRMCHPCLKRIFRLSIKDPQHMPPKCCTLNHIPLKHVDRLFDMDFKKRWNTKFHEYTTQNRIYCPARRCGEWIRPSNIHTEDGQKWGKCGRCKTKVCTLCSGKWHGSKDCPKDEATKALLDQAARSGWQRCYSCREMVELKEGCNHMTCRCRAEFCMICGHKWRTCNCPWFSYAAVEADRQNHLHERDEPHHARNRAFAFLDEDEGDEVDLADRLDNLVLNDQHATNRTYRRPLPHFVPVDAMATDYLAGVNSQRFPVSSMRLQTQRTQQHEADTDPSLAPRIRPRQARPRRAATVLEGQPPPILVRRVLGEESERTSVLAGLGRRGVDRVSGWRRHVMPGIEPEEGMLSIV